MNKIICFLFVFTCSTLFSQNKVEHFFNAIKTSNYTRAKEIIQGFDDVNIKFELETFYNIMRHKKIIPPKTKNKNDSLSLTYNLKLLNESLYQYLVKGNEINSIKILKKAITLSKIRNDKVLTCEAIKIALEIYQRFTSVIGDDSYKYYIKEYKKNTYDEFEMQNCILKEFKIKRKYDFIINSENKTNFKIITKELSNINSEFLKAKRDITFSAYNLYEKKDLESSYFYILQAINNLKNNEGLFENERLISAKINLAIILYEKKNFKEANNILIDIKIDDQIYIFKLLKVFLYYWKFKINEALENKYEALNYYNKYLELELLNDQSKKIQIVSEYEAKYQTAEKEKKILQQQTEIAKKKRQQRNLWIGGIITLLFGSIFGFLVYKNTKRKQRIAEQERELEIQKTEKILKEQELTTIDAMIAGQEKERQRLASDLHDSVGATLSAARLQFEHLEKHRNKLENEEELFTKTGKLLEEAYQEVRTMAHAKNSGVIAKKGLLPAVEKLARNASGASKLTIEVQDFGLTERIDNTLEITIFRIIQELVTNIIKHANASEASISLTQHDTTLSIIVEDNGKGFNPRTMNDKDGMGLSSIEKRVEHLEGSMEVDSTPGNGTNILIDIPI